MNKIIGYLTDGLALLWQWFRKIYHVVSTFVTARPYLSVLLTFTGFFLTFFAVYFQVGTLSTGDDHFFLFRFAQDFANNGFFHSFQEFKSIYFSRIALGGEYFVYYNFLFFLVIFPFTFIAPLYLGIKLYAVIAAAGAFTFLYWCFKRIYIKNPLIWTLAILSITNIGSIWRFFSSRSFALAPSLLLLLLYFLYKKNYLGICLVSFAYLYWNSLTFFLPVCVVIIYYVIERFYRDKGDWKSLLAGFGGTLIAVAMTYLVSPGFLLYIKDVVFNIYWETILGQKVALAEGGELYPIDFFNFIQANALIFATFVTALSVDLFSYVGYKFKNSPASEYFADTPKERRHLHTTILVLTACFFLGTVAASARFGDYFTFFAALYVALSFDYSRRLISITGGSLIKQSLITGLTIVLLYLFVSNMLFLSQKLARGQSAFEFYQTGNWLAENSKAGDIVFEANWSWFPQLYYWSPKNYYTSGLEPRFMYNYSKRLYWLSVHMADNATLCEKERCPDLDESVRLALKQGTSSESFVKNRGNEIATVMRKDFTASYIVTSKGYQIFNYVLSNNSNFKLESYDPAFGLFVFRVNEISTSSRATKR